MQGSTAAYKTVIAGASQTVEHQVSLTLPPAAGLSRVNLATDPTFEGATTLWVTAGNPQPGFALSSTRAFSGSKSLLVTWAAGNVFLPTAAYLLPTTPGITYTASFYVYVPASGISVFLAVGGLGLAGFSAASSVTDQWQRLNVTFTATLTAHYVSVTPNGTPTAGQTCFVDAVLVEQGSVLGSYFDGYSAGASWSGDPDRSTSILQTNPYQDVSLTVESLTVDRQLTTDMPDGTRLITGYPAASAQLTLSGYVDQTPGASKSIAWLLNPAEPTSPLYRSDALGSPITIKTGVYPGGTTTPELFTIFTGTVDDYTVNAQAGTVTLTCLDARGRFAAVPPLPLAAFSQDSVSAAYLGASAGQLLTSGWVLNLMCESIGLYTSPPPRNQCVFRMTGHGGAWPETGWDAAAQVAAPAFLDEDGNVLDPADPGWTTGQFSPQVPNRVIAQYANAPVVGLPNGTIDGNMGSSGNSWFFECWVKARTSATLVEPDGLAVNFALGGTSTVIDLGAAATSLGSALRPYVTVFQSPSLTTIHPASLTIPNDGAWHYFAVAFHFTSTTGFTATFYVDGTTQTASGSSGTAIPANEAIAQATVVAWTPAESIQVSNETGTPPSNSTFTPSALVDLDPSLNNLTAVPDVAGQDAWNVLQQIAQAEGGIVGFDELGVFRFINRDTLRVQADQRTITPTYSLKTLDQEMGLSFVRNHIQLPVNKLQVQPASTVWSAADAIEIPAHATYTQVITTDNPVVNVSRIGAIMPNGGGTPGLTYWRACTTQDGTGAERTLLTVTVEQLGPATLVLKVVSPYGYPVWLVSPTGGGYPAAAVGLPRMWIGGNFVTATGGTSDTTAGGDTPAAVIADSQWPPVVDGGAVANPRGEKLLVLSSNPFVQEVNSGQTFTDDTLIDLYKPRPLWRNTSIVPDPSLQLADRVLVRDTDTTMVNDSALIVGVHISAGRTDWSMNLDLRAISTPGGWVMGVAGRSEMGVATYM